MKISYYDSATLIKLFGISKIYFHRKVKPKIIADFKKELEYYNIKNPDIGIDNNNYIYLSDTNHVITITTNLTIKDYLDD